MMMVMVEEVGEERMILTVTRIFPCRERATVGRGLPSVAWQDTSTSSPTCTWGRAGSAEWEKYKTLTVEEMQKKKLHLSEMLADFATGQFKS